MTEPNAAHLEVWRRAGPQVASFAGDRIALGRAAENDVALDDDSTASRMHAVIERFPGGWCVRDLGSRNGTFVNGAQVTGETALHSGDELRIGGTRVVFRAGDARGGEATEVRETIRRPELTRRERDVLVALCRPLLGGHGLFTEPATVRQVAEELSVTEAAVKQHLANLYDKFRFNDPSARRRVHLANQAVAQGVITVSMLRDPGR